MLKYVSLVFVFAISGCITLPFTMHETRQCKLSTDKKTLKIVDIAKETNTFYSVSGVLLSPVLVPTTALLSGSYVAVNNLYHLGEKRIKCESSGS